MIMRTVCTIHCAFFFYYLSLGTDQASMRVILLIASYNVCIVFNLCAMIWDLE